MERLPGYEPDNGRSSRSGRVLQAYGETGIASGSEPEGYRFPKGLGVSAVAIPVAPAVAVASLVVQRIVDPPVVGFPGD